MFPKIWNAAEIPEPVAPQSYHPKKMLMHIWTKETMVVGVKPFSGATCKQLTSILTMKAIIIPL